MSVQEENKFNKKIPLLGKGKVNRWGDNRLYRISCYPGWGSEINGRYI